METNNWHHIRENSRGVSHSQSELQETDVVFRNKRGLESPEKQKRSQKQLKLSSYWLSKPAKIVEPADSNRFSVLDDEDEIEVVPKDINPIIKAPKPPPIYISKVDNILPLRALLEILATNSYEMKILRNNEVKIQASTIEIFKKITKSLEDKSTEFHTFKPKQERSYNVVLKGIHSSTPIDHIIEEISNLGHEVLNISNIKDRMTKKPLQMFYVGLKQNPNNKEIFNCNALLHTKVKFEAPRKKREIAQCTRCQRYGHTKSYCHHTPRCVKCTGSHATSECLRKTKSNDVKCVLCNGDHPANYKGCAVYKQLQQKTYPPLRNRQTNLVPQQQNLQFTSETSYAQALKGDSVQKENIQQQPNDMADLKAMMKTLIEQMSTMMTLLTTIVSKLV